MMGNDNLFNIFFELGSVQPCEGITVRVQWFQMPHIVSFRPNCCSRPRCDVRRGSSFRVVITLYHETQRRSLNEDKETNEVIVTIDVLNPGIPLEEFLSVLI